MTKKRIERGFELPEIIDPLTSKCVVINVPDDLRHFAAFWGALQALQYPSNWEGTKEQQQEVAQVWTEVIRTARDNWDSGECLLPAKFRTNPVTGAIEYQPLGGDTWEQIGDPCACPDPNVISPPYNPDQTDPNASACAIATNFIQWLWDKSNDVANTFEAAADTIAFMDTIGVVFPPAYLLGDAITDIFNELAESGVAILRAWLSTDRKEDHQEWLYCELKGMSPPEISQTVWSSYKEWVDESGGEPLGKAAFKQIVNALKYEAISDRSRISSYGDGNCAAFDCGEVWEHEWFFDQVSGQDDGWELFVFNGYTLGTYTPGVGWQSTIYPPLSAQNISIIKTNTDPSTKLTYVQMKGTSPDIGPANGRGIVINGTLVKQGSGTAPLQDIVWEGELTMDSLRLTLGTNFQPDPQVETITYAKVRGTGTDPFA